MSLYRLQTNAAIKRELSTNGKVYVGAIAGDTGLSVLHGGLRCLKIYDKALTQRQIQQEQICELSEYCLLPSGFDMYILYI